MHSQTEEGLTRHRWGWSGDHHGGNHSSQEQVDEEGYTRWELERLKEQHQVRYKKNCTEKNSNQNKKGQNQTR